MDKSTKNKQLKSRESLQHLIQPSSCALCAYIITIYLYIIFTSLNQAHTVANKDEERARQIKKEKILVRHVQVHYRDHMLLYELLHEETNEDVTIRTVLDGNDC